LEPKERVWWLKMSFSPLRANNAPTNPLAGFERPLRGGRNRGKIEEREGIRKERIGTKGTGETPPPLPSLYGFVSPCS